MHIIHAAVSLCVVSLSQPELAPAPGVAERMADISPARLMASVEKLCTFETRHTLSDTKSPTRGIGAAREWLRAELASTSPRLHASLEPFDVPKSVRLPDGARVVNVVGVLPGTSDAAKDRAYYVVGHYDSRNADAMDATGAAPGANDDASGTALVLECARVLAQHPCESTIVFLCTAAEEQGLVGAHAHAKSLAGENRYRLVQVLSNDIVGDPSPFVPDSGYAELFKDHAERDGPFGDVINDSKRENPGKRIVRVFSEGVPRSAAADVMARIRSEGAESDSPSRQLARFVAFVAKRERTVIQPMLVFRQDRFLRGGDHSAFNEAGFPAVRFTVPAEDYSRQHQNVSERNGKPYGDVASFVDGEYLANVTRLNLATLIHMANAPTPPGSARIITAELATDTLLRWDASPEPDTAGYEVVYRLTTDADWTGVIDAGTSRELRVGLNKDNVFFGVRAYDRDGFRSPISFAWAAKE